EEHLGDLTQIVGGMGTDPAIRLGLAAESDEDAVRAAALEAVRMWRARARHPLLDRPTALACEAAARSAEGVLAGLAR
ncbi:MAG: Isoniazid-inducible protein iniC, partial [Mycobacterium sp.]|nr:Isoniazid-inducible protein iniC [Mycobacterium sp.]